MNKEEIFQWIKDNGEMIGVLSLHGNQYACKVREIFSTRIYPDPYDEDAWILLRYAIKEYKEWQRRSKLE